MPTAIESAIERCEAALCDALQGGAACASGEVSLGADGKTMVSSRDPDDPWADEMTLPEWVKKERCPVSGYWMTKPFEKVCPMPDVFKGDTTYLNLLNPIIGAVADAKEAKATDAGKATKGDKPDDGKKADKAAKKAAAKAKAAAAPAADEDPLELLAKAKLVVARVAEVGHVENSDKLYLCQVEVAPGEVKQVVTGLRKHVPQDQLQGARVMVITNLKTAKLAGQLSEAMILCGTGGDKVVLSAAPEGAEVGTRVFAAGAEPKAPPPKECKSKFWDRIKAQLAVQGGEATYAGKVLAAGAAGAVKVPDVPDASPIS